MSIVSIPPHLRARCRALEPVAVLYQAAPAPLINGTMKPMKPGGYSDSGADIAAALHKAQIHIIPATSQPDEERALDWVLPDTESSITALITEKCVNTLWANTVLFEQHPLQQLVSHHSDHIMVVGQSPYKQQLYDSKLITNQLLASNGIPIPAVMLIGDIDHLEQHSNYPLPIYPNNQPLTEDILHQHHLALPVIVKPIRGRGSQGVLYADTISAITSHIAAMLSSHDYGNVVMIEEYLPGEELTVAVMPPGEYMAPINQQSFYWCLPLVRRDQHTNGVLPYSGDVAIVQNSYVIDPSSISPDSHYARIISDCVQAATILALTSVIRIDCRADMNGIFHLFDTNIKPNMTGMGRLGRDDQNSLVALAASALGWDFSTLIINLLLQAKPLRQLQSK